MALNSLDKQNRCQARTKLGKPCQAAATEGGLCFFHGNPDKASELGRLGGRNNRHVPLENLDAIPKLETATDLRDLVARLILELYERKLHPRIASGLAPLVNLQLRAIEATDLERRLKKVEKLLDIGEENGQESDSDSSMPRAEISGGDHGPE